MLGNEVLYEYVFDAFAPKDIAERLTYLGASAPLDLRFIAHGVSEWEIFVQIRPSELLGTAWQKEQRTRLAPNVLALIDQFNRVVGWVATEIIWCGAQRPRCSI